MHRADVFLVGAVVAQRLAHGLDDGRNSRVGDDPAVPDLLYQFILADQPVGIFDQIAERCKGASLKRHGFPRVLKLAAIQIQRKTVKNISQRRALAKLTLSSRNTQTALKSATSA